MGKFFRQKNSKHLTESEVSSLVTAFENESLNTLQDILENQETYWMALEKTIPHLDKRILMLLDVKAVEDNLAQNYGAPIVYTPFFMDIKMGILFVSHLIGNEQTKRLLEEKPIAFFLAATITYIHRARWIQDETVDTRLYLQLFFNTLSIMQLSHFDPIFMTLMSEKHVDANRYFQLTAIAEIDACDFDADKRQELVRSVTQASEDLLMNLTQF